MIESKNIRKTVENMTCNYDPSCYPMPIDELNNKITSSIYSYCLSNGFEEDYLETLTVEEFVEFEDFIIEDYILDANELKNIK